MEGLSKKEKKKKFMDIDNSVVIARERGSVEVEDCLGGINDDRRKLGLRW